MATIHYQQGLDHLSKEKRIFVHMLPRVNRNQPQWILREVKTQSRLKLTAFKTKLSLDLTFQEDL